MAFGDGRRIRWDQNSDLIFRDNPNLARPGEERRPDLEWIGYFKGQRIYNTNDAARRRWVWNLDFRAEPGEVFLSAGEIRAGRRFGRRFVVIEPYVPSWKSVAPNKDWGAQRYQAVVDRLAADGLTVLQFLYDKGGPALRGAHGVRTAGFRDALAILGQAALFIGPEGGLHHGAAAMGTKGVVLFGGFIPPSVTGYAAHTNLTGGAEACGSYTPCAHCRVALDAISVEEVYAAARRQLGMAV
ncbi:glycosyltransferase family 9 protein [Phenylobacterium sp.]|uniref:glycosyltransferase family 9 protein n=1 Tax=Phenylobacterium sp. TaxID=1871053 RepID=UPI0025E053D9|nr:glycosyltransferase family 9 protein [Phenylobacterium sp.]MBX3482528.1 hypothetical protein [Phenylobacterium sp.]